MKQTPMGGFKYRPLPHNAAINYGQLRIAGSNSMEIIPHGWHVVDAFITLVGKIDTACISSLSFSMYFVQ
jgi:hypothetical protein